MVYDYRNLTDKGANSQRSGAGTPRSLQGILEKPERVVRPLLCTLQVLFHPLAALECPLVALSHALELSQRLAPLGKRQPVLSEPQPESLVLLWGEAGDQLPKPLLHVLVLLGILS
jgi:hypothetical protein